MTQARRFAPKLRKGDLIGVCAPASPVSQKDVEEAVSMVESRGYRVLLSPHIYKTASPLTFLAGSDRQRADDLHSLWANEDVRAIICARGGYGSMRLFPLLDRELLNNSNKLFVGYSDITSLHALLNTEGLVTVHGPGFAAIPKLTDGHAIDVYWRLLESDSPLGVLPANSNTITSLVGGEAEGVLAGGNICLLAHTLGSRNQPDFTDKIVLLEDIGEKMYEVDRYMTQLLNAEMFTHAAGFIIGSITGWKPKEGIEECVPLDIWTDRLAGLGAPIITNFPCGHEPNPLSLPLGTTVRLNADAKTVELLETAVC